MPILAFLEKHLSAAALEQVRASGKPALPYRLQPAHALPPEASRVGGIGYWPQDRDYPRNADERPLALLAQFNLGELPAGAAQALALPASGLLAFYIDPHSDDYGSSAAVCLYFADTSTPSLSRDAQRALFAADDFPYLDNSDDDEEDEDFSPESWQETLAVLEQAAKPVTNITDWCENMHGVLMESDEEDFSPEFWQETLAVLEQAAKPVTNIADWTENMRDVLMESAARANAENPPDAAVAAAMQETIRQFVAAFDADVAAANDTTLTQQWQKARPRVVALQPADPQQLSFIVPLQMPHCISLWQRRYQQMPPAWRVIEAALPQEDYWQHPVDGEYGVAWQPLTNRYLLRDNREFFRHYGKKQPQWLREQGLKPQTMQQLEALLDEHQPNNTLGGDPYFIEQEDPRRADGDDVLLFQLDRDGHASTVGVMWDNDGIGMFFIRPADLHARRFAGAWFSCCASRF